MKIFTLRIDRLGLSLPLFVGTLVSIVWLVQPNSTFLNDPDTYLHIEAGQWIISHQAVPDVDPFSHTMLGKPWLAHEWLSEVIIALIYKLGSWSALVFISIACAAMTIAYLLRFLLDRVPAVFALLFTTLTYYAMLPHLLARPHVLVWPLLVFWVCLLVQASEDKLPPPWWLPGIMALWANLHGSFILGLLIIIPVGIEAIIQNPATIKKETTVYWIRFGVLSLLLAMCTPQGWHGIIFFFHLSSIDQLLRIAEWQPESFAQLNPLEIWIGTLLALSCLGYLNLPIMRLLLLLGLLHISLSHGRHTSIFGFLVPILIATPFSKCYRAHHYSIRDPAHPYPWHFHVLSRTASARSVFLSLCILSLVAMLTAQTKHRIPQIKITPETALDKALEMKLNTGIVFNDYIFGGYLIYRGIPVFIDGRVDMYGNNGLNNYLSIHDSSSTAQLSKALDKFQVTWTIQPAGVRLVDLLDQLPEWERVFADDIAVVHARHRHQ